LVRYVALKKKKNISIFHAVQWVHCLPRNHTCSALDDFLLAPAQLRRLRARAGCSATPWMTLGPQALSVLLYLYLLPYACGRFSVLPAHPRSCSMARFCSGRPTGLIYEVQRIGSALHIIVFR
jgi:hypothetical protein